MNRIIIISVICICLCGCTGKHCISVGGDYEGIQGNINWCWDAAQSANLGKTILASDDKMALLLTEEDAKKLNEEFLGEEVKAQTKDVSKITEIKRLIERLRRK